MTVLSRPAIPEQRATCRPRHPVAARVCAGVAATAVLALGLVSTRAAVRYAHDDSRRHYLGPDGWPAHGQAAYAEDNAPAQVSPQQNVAPIASIAKVMTAYLVLSTAPLHTGIDGFRLVVTAADVADTGRRIRRAESVVRVRTDEVLSEREALAALLLPSANNVAVMLARQLDGTVAAFVARMNATARALGMRHTTYTDPSGFDSGTRSTAADQLILARVVMRDGTFRQLVARKTYVLPVAGTVHNTDLLLGKSGFVGIKTGSDDAAGGCFMFQVRRSVAGHRVVLTGVVLGQHGHSPLLAGQYAGRQLADQVMVVG